MAREGDARAAQPVASVPGWQTLTLRWMAAAELRAQPARWLTAALAVAIGVALGYAVHLVNRSALDEFARAVQTVNGAADLQVQATQARGFDENLYPVLARIPGVAQASPVVELTLPLPERRRLTVLGLDVLRAARVTPSLLGRPFPANGAGAAFDLFEQDAVYLSSAAASALNAQPGHAVRLGEAAPDANWIYRGTLPGASDSRLLAVMDIAAAQWKLGALGRLQRIDLALQPGADAAAVQAAVRAVLPADAQLVTPQSEAQRSDSLSRAYRVNLEMLAMVALLTGGFLVYSAQSLSVVRRRAPFALLRVLGLRRGALLRQLLVEGAALGVLGSVLGLALGAALAALALRLLGGDLGGGYFAATRPALSLSPVAALVFFLLGVLVAIAGSLWPAVQALQVQAAVALLASPINGADPQHGLPLVGLAQAVPQGQIAIWVSEPFAMLYGKSPGQTLELPLGGQLRTLFVAGVWRDYSRQFGALAMDERDYEALTGDSARAEAAIDLRSGASAQTTIEALRQALPPDLAGRAEFARPGEIRAIALKIFDRSFAATYALEAIAILVGMAGVAATFSAQTLARTREFGMLRHIGVLRRQVLAMLALEGALLGGVGGVAGLALGTAMGQVLIQVVNPQSFHWTMDTRWPLTLFAALWLGLVLASALTAMLAGRSALSSDAVRAVREDW